MFPHLTKKASILINKTSHIYQLRQPHWLSQFARFTNQDGRIIMDTYDHIVVGAGIMGSCTAYQLAKRGESVLVLEKFPLPHTRGSSTGQSRGIRRAYPDPLYHSLMEEAYSLWEDIEKESKTKLIINTGLLVFSDTPEDQTLKSVIKAFERTQGSIYKVYEGKEFKHSFPYLNMGDSGAGCLDPSGGIIMADKAVRTIQEMAVSHGAKIIDGFDVNTIAAFGNQVYIRGLDETLYMSKSAILCPGPWANKILAKLNVHLPLTPMKIPVYYWKQHQFLPHTFIVHNESMNKYGSDVDIWGLPTFEYPGLVKICLHYGPTVDPDHRDSVSTDQIKKLLQTFIKTYFPGVEPTVSVEESCIYTNTPDFNPILDLVPGYDNIAMGIGFSGTGFKLGPVVGNILADFAQGKHPTQDIQKLQVARFMKEKL